MKRSTSPNGDVGAASSKRPARSASPSSSAVPAYKKPAVLSFFNHKGGVAKTTSTFNVAWDLCRKGKNVVMIDMDAQCNLTQLILSKYCRDTEGVVNFDKWYLDPQHPYNNVVECLRPVIQDLPEQIRVPYLFSVANAPGSLRLLPGHHNIGTFEERVAMAYGSNGLIHKNTLGALQHLITKLAQHYKDVDVVICDLSPSVSSLNRSILMSSDYFMCPCAPDFFSHAAIGILADILPDWTSKQANFVAVSADSPYKLELKTPKFLGCVLLRYTHLKTSPAKNFQVWFTKIGERVENRLVPALRAVGMVLDPYPEPLVQKHYIISGIHDFAQLSALSHLHAVPVVGLEREHLTHGDVKKKMAKKQADAQVARIAIFRRLFDKVSSAILHMVEGGQGAYPLDIVEPEDEDVVVEEDEEGNDGLEAMDE